MAGALPVLLHVEDNLDDVALLREALQEIGTPHRYLVAENAVQAYNHLRLMSGGFAPALVVMDLNLPIIKGHIALRELRAHIPWARTAMVVLTSSQAPMDLLQATNVGATECLLKPPTFEGYLEIGHRLSKYLTPPPAGRRRSTSSDIRQAPSADASGSAAG